ncbi:MAG: metallophosphoesterase [Hyphomicrobiales bacterium]|nr:MAG: metallophosphoesterase [Hyphomicrobiales bacterium]
MKIAVISDIHGNRLALEAVLDDIARQGVDGTFNLGDLVAGPMEPNWVLDILMDIDIPTVRGNHERALIDNPPEKLGPVDRFAQIQMEARHRGWINALPPTLSIVDDIFLCHGTPTSDEEPWLDGWWDGRTTTIPDHATVAAKAEGFDYPVLLCGHTHIPRAVRLRDGRLIVNPGAVGLQLNHGSPDARYATVELRGGKYYAAFHTVPYDHFAAARQAEANGFPQWRDALIAGWVGAKGLF